MSKELEEQLRAKLLEKKKNLEAELSGFAAQDPKAAGNWNARYGDMQAGKPGGLEAAADEVEEYSTNLSLEASLEQQLQDVNAALERMEKGTYGKCGRCGKEIEQEKLLAMPETKLCTDCAKSA